MNKTVSIILSVACAILFIGFIIVGTKYSQLSTQVSALASTTNARLEPVEAISSEILNLRQGGLIASSTGMIIAIYNAQQAITELLKQTQPVTVPVKK